MNLTYVKKIYKLYIPSLSNSRAGESSFIYFFHKQKQYYGTSNNKDHYEDISAVHSSVHGGGKGVEALGLASSFGSFQKH